MRMTPIAPALAVLLAVTLASCQKHSSTRILPIVPGGDAHRGSHLASYYGCGSCHEIPGVPNADGVVGPPLTDFARRIYVAGVLRNTPDNLVHWISDPQSVVPHNAMPDMGIDQRDARDIAAFLYTER